MNNNFKLPTPSNLNRCNPDSIKSISNNFNATVLDGGLGRCKEVDQLFYNKIIDTYGLSAITNMYTNKQEWFVNENSLFYLNPYAGGFEFPFDSHIVSVGNDLIKITKKNDSEVVNIKTKYFQSFKTMSSNPNNVSYLYGLFQQS